MSTFIMQSKPSIWKAKYKINNSNNNRALSIDFANGKPNTFLSWHHHSIRDASIPAAKEALMCR
jgi:uncharacterized protein YxjI